MIDSLRKKVFWSILLSASGVLLVILTAFNVLQLAQTAAKQDSILHGALTLLQDEPGAEKGRGGREGKDKAELLRSVSEDELGVVLLDRDGGLLAAAGCAEEMDDESLSALTAAALADKNGQGHFAGWNYQVIRLADSTTVSFLDAASLRAENTGTLLLSLAGFAAACCLFALLARVLSRAIVRPVEENMQAQKRFIADASHELKTPLTVIDANASVLEQSIGENKWLGYIQEQSARMAGLVNELLQLSHLEEDTDAGLPPQREPFDAAEAVLAASLPFESVAYEKGLTLQTDVPESLPALGSEKELEQLAAILTDNAIKHSEAGGTVMLSLRAVSERHGLKELAMLELRVRNTGKEIPPEALPHIFDRFYRADPSRAHKDGSYGLGLAIARSLAEKNKGSLTAASENGSTEFTFRMPLG